MRKILFACLLLLYMYSSKAQTITGDTTICAGDSTTLTVTGISGSPALQWQYSNVVNGVYTDIAGATAAQHIIKTSGFYRVMVGAAATNAVQVIVNTKPLASFTQPSGTPCSGIAVQFNGNASNGTAPYNYYWKFGDGGTANVQNPTHVFDTSGCSTTTYQDTLIVEDANGCRDTAVKPITIKQKPAVSVKDQNLFYPFSNCQNAPTPSNPNYTLTINNTSADAGCITTYNIDWGDGTIQNGLTAASFPLTHTYTQLGAFNLSVTGVGSNGCNATKVYTIANQTNPAGGLGTLGSTTNLCTPATVPFVINNWKNNSPGTTYKVEFGDGSQTILTHPLTSDTLYHTYTTSSCQLASKSFTAILTVSNGCDKTPYTAGNIQIRTKPQAAFTGMDKVCVNTSLCFTNTTVAGNFGTDCSTTTAFNWNFGDPASGPANTSTNESACHVFSAPGTYTVTLTATNPCGTTTFTKQVCVVAPPQPSFTIDVTTGCGPLTVQTTNTSNGLTDCIPAVFGWSVSYASGNCGTTGSYVFANGTTAASTSPAFTFSNPGTYTITLTATNACGSFVSSKQVVVKGKPSGSIQNIAPGCSPYTISPVANVNNCGGTNAISYAWTFTGGLPATSTQAVPGAIQYTSAGNYTIALAATNECGTYNTTGSFSVTETPVLTVPGNVEACHGSMINAIGFSSNPAATITWTNNNATIGLGANGTGNINSFTAVNAGNSPVTATINVTANASGCTDVKSFTITVNPKPAVPQVTSPVNYCVGQTATALTATASGSNTLVWYNTATGGSPLAAAPVPVTIAATTMNYYVSQVSAAGNCESNRASIQVTVNAIPTFTATASMPTACGSSNGSIQLTGLTPNTAYVVQYTKNTVAETKPLNADGTGKIILSNLSSGNYEHITVTLNGCTSAEAGPFNFTDPTPPSTPVITPIAPVCSGANVTLTATSTTTGTISYTWTGPGSYTKTNTTGIADILAITQAQAGTYSVIATQNGCNSIAASINVVVNLTPVAPVATANTPICTGNTLQLQANSSTAGVTYSWTGAGSFSSSQQNPAIAAITAADAGVYTVKAILGNCESTGNVTVVVNLTPVITGSNSTNPASCSAANGTITLSGLTAGNNYNVQYLKSGNPVSVTLTANAAGEVVITGLTAGSYSQVKVVRNNCASNEVGPFILSDPTPPATPVIPAVAPLCSGTTLNLSVNTIAGATYQWSGPNAFNASVQNPTRSSVTLADDGVYQVTATVSGCTSPPASVTVTIHPTPVINAITYNTPLCSGGTLNLQSGTSFSGGISWYWTGPASFNSNVANPSIPNLTTANSGTYKVVAVANTGNCASDTQQATIQVQLTPVITAVQTIDPVNCGSATGKLVLEGLVSGTTYKVDYVKGSTAQTVNLIANASGEVVINNLTAGTYSNIRVTINGCVSNDMGPYTLSDPNPPPAPVVTNPAPVCEGGILTLTALPVANATYQWSGPNGFFSVLANPIISPVSLQAAGVYQLTVTVNNCISPATTVTAIVHPTPVITSVSANTPLCTGNTLSLQASTAFVGQVNWQWTGPNSFSGTQQNPVINNITLNEGGNYIVTATAGTGSCVSATKQITVVVKPTPIISNVVANHPTACSTPSGSIRLDGLTPNTAYIVNYTYGGNPITINISSNAAGQLLITNLTAGLYEHVKVTLDGCPSAEAAPVQLTDPTPPAIPQASSNAPICNGNNLLLTATTTTTGSTYVWSGPNGFSSFQQNPIIPAAGATDAGTYSVQAVNNNCYSQPATINVVINPLAAAPQVNTPITYCKDATATPLTAQALTGHALNWYTTPTGGTALTTAPIPATSVAGSTFYYVSQTTPSGCEGARASIEVIVHPDAKALFIPQDTIGCSPYVLTPAYIGIQQYPAQNSNYQWFVNNVLLGTGSVFPGYTLTGSAASVTIQLKAISAFGCKNDSISRIFNTYRLPATAFTVSDTVGCGPLTVQITNTTPNANEFNFIWDFGNGQTSQLIQPGSIIFQPNPLFTDTVYHIKLKAFTVCDTIYFTKDIRVKSKPKSIFTPDKSSGCSPMPVTFSNLSAGLNMQFFWSFGDGNTSANQAAAVQHTFITGVQDTFYVKLTVTNTCGSDTSSYAIVTSPNAVHLDVAINGNQSSGCGPHTVRFINTSSGATGFQWNFGDGNTLSTTKNKDTVTHVFYQAGTYTVTLFATNGCSDTTTTETIKVYNKPIASFNYQPLTACLGDTIHFTSTTDTATSLLWRFGDGYTSVLQQPVHAYQTTGNYFAKLIAYRLYADGTVCSDSITKPVAIVDKQQGFFTVKDTAGTCVPFTTTFTNQSKPSIQTIWDFGDGKKDTADVVAHTYTIPGSYIVTMSALHPGGCKYEYSRTIKVQGPQATWSYNHGYICNQQSVQFTALAQNADSLIWHFGDGTRAAGIVNNITHAYANPGIYVPSLELVSGAGGCRVLLKGTDTIRVDKINAGFFYTSGSACGSSNVLFTDTSYAYFGLQQWQWNFGDNSPLAATQHPAHIYTASNTWPLQLIVTGKSGCKDTVNLQANIKVNSLPIVAIQGSNTACALQPETYQPVVTSVDPITFYQWNISGGGQYQTAQITHPFATAGTANIQLVVGTAFGCFDTATQQVTIHPTPTVKASADVTICKGNTTNLSATGTTSLVWEPSQALSCTACANTAATPGVTTQYFVKGTNAQGCSSRDSVVVTVIQPLNMQVTPSDSICIGDSKQLIAAGAASYSWSPATGLNATNIATPVATPQLSTLYRVIGKDAYNCFSDTQYVTIGVGRYPVVSLGADKTLATGTLLPLTSTITNGPIETYNWTPARDLSCNNCPQPIATIRTPVCYAVNATNYFGCSGTDTVCIKVFCENTQLFIPNAFTPDGDGINDKLEIKASGIQTVRSFRIFNRWGQVVFERSNFPPNSAAYAWDGTINGVAATPGVYVYTCEVMCENGTTYSYKGNTAIIK